MSNIKINLYGFIREGQSLYACLFWEHDSEQQFQTWHNLFPNAFIVTSFSINARIYEFLTLLFFTHSSWPAFNLPQINSSDYFSEFECWKYALMIFMPTPCIHHRGRYNEHQSNRGPSVLESWHRRCMCSWYKLLSQKRSCFGKCCGILLIHTARAFLCSVLAFIHCRAWLLVMTC